LTTTHACRWHLQRGTVGQGAVYQGRFKAIPIEADAHFLRICRYVERNACRAGLVDKAEDWRWCSLWRREHHVETTWLRPWPVPRPSDWLTHVNRPQTASELDAIRTAIRRGLPYGTTAWAERLDGDEYKAGAENSRGEAA
jgi:putative transposase